MKQITADHPLQKNWNMFRPIQKMFRFKLVPEKQLIDRICTKEFVEQTKCHQLTNLGSYNHVKRRSFVHLTRA